MVASKAISEGVAGLAAQSRRATTTGRAAAPGASRRAEGAPTAARRYRAERRSPARATLLIVGGLIVVVAVILVVVFSGGGSKGASSTAGGNSSESTASGSQSATSGHATTTKAKSKSSSSSGSGAAAVNPAETNVVVLNGTGTTGLAHHVSGELNQHGFTRASALDGRPPGANEVTVVEYTSGHQADAQSVAQALGVSQAQPIEGTVASMAGSASVVVIVGLDKAATSP
jgi:hypothetical protein